MTLDELIAQAETMRARFGGDTTVLLLTAGGYAHPALADGIGFATADGKGGEPVVLIGRGANSPATRPS